MSSRRRYTPEQKAEAVRLRKVGLPLVLVSRQLGIPLANISRWVLDDLRAAVPDPRQRRRELLRGSR